MSELVHCRDVEKSFTKGKQTVEVLTGINLASASVTAVRVPGIP
jgi:hypothetical protein